jgi:hypothetical protein
MPMVAVVFEPEITVLAVVRTPPLTTVNAAVFDDPSPKSSSLDAAMNWELVPLIARELLPPDPPGMLIAPPVTINCPPLVTLIRAESAWGDTLKLPVVSLEAVPLC